MATARNELDVELAELEVRLERLRSLYEQYFIGLEKLEPTIPRQDVDRRIAALRKARIRNTAKRYKFQTLIQRYNSFQQYWTRVCREMENGTYHRHIARAKRRFGDVPLAAAGRKRTRGQKESQPPEGQQERAKRQAEDDLDALLREDPEEAMRRALAEAADSVEPRPRSSEMETPTDPLPPPRHSTDPVSSISRAGSDISMTIPAAPPHGPPSEPGRALVASPPEASLPPPRKPRSPVAQQGLSSQSKSVGSPAASGVASRKEGPANDVGAAASAPRLPSRAAGDQDPGARSPLRSSAEAEALEAAVAAQRAQPVVVRAGDSIGAGKSAAEARQNSWPILRPSSPASGQGGKEVGMGRVSAPPLSPSRRRERPPQAGEPPRSAPMSRPPPMPTAAGGNERAPARSPGARGAAAPASSASAAGAGAGAAAARVRSGSATSGEARTSVQQAQVQKPVAAERKPSDGAQSWHAARAQVAEKEKEREARARAPRTPDRDRWAEAKERAERKRNAPVAPAAPASSASAVLSSARISELHARLVSERKRLGQAGRVSLESLEKTMRATESKLRNQYAGKPVDFQVVVKNGKAIVKPIVG